MLNKQVCLDCLPKMAPCTFSKLAGKSRHCFFTKEHQRSASLIMNTLLKPEQTRLHGSQHTVTLESLTRFSTNTNPAINSVEQEPELIRQQDMSPEYFQHQRNPGVDVSTSCISATEGWLYSALTADTAEETHHHSRLLVFRG